MDREQSLSYETPRGLAIDAARGWALRIACAIVGAIGSLALLLDSVAFIQARTKGGEDMSSIGGLLKAIAETRHAPAGSAALTMLATSIALLLPIYASPLILWSGVGWMRRWRLRGVWVVGAIASLSLAIAAATEAYAFASVEHSDAHGTAAIVAAAFYPFGMKWPMAAILFAESGQWVNRDRARRLAIGACFVSIGLATALTVDAAFSQVDGSMTMCQLLLNEPHFAAFFDLFRRSADSLGDTAWRLWPIRAIGFAAFVAAIGAMVASRRHLFAWWCVSIVSLSTAASLFGVAMLYAALRFGLGVVNSLDVVPYVSIFLVYALPYVCVAGFCVVAAGFALRVSPTPVAADRR